MNWLPTWTDLAIGFGLTGAALIAACLYVLRSAQRDCEDDHQ